MTNGIINIFSCFTILKIFGKTIHLTFFSITAFDGENKSISIAKIGYANSQYKLNILCF